MSSIAPILTNPDFTSYDKVPYPSSSFPSTHPNRIAAIARLFGVAAASPSSGRVLELGCSDGGNLLPMAEMAPNATFLGIDASKVQIAAGQKIVSAINLPNVELRHQDILSFSAEEGLFDYIIVHGIFSWVPEPVRDKIFAIAETHLSPNGIAFISFNALPGAGVRNSLREMVLFHTRGIADLEAKAKEARIFLKFLSDSMATDTTGYASLLNAELQRVERSSDHYFLHEFLEEENTAFYIHEFLNRAARHELQYLSEPCLSHMAAGAFSGKAREALAQIGDLVAQEQYADFLRNRTFRETLLCRATVEIRRDLTADLMQNFAFQANFQGSQEVPDLTEGIPVRFAMREGPSFSVSSAIVKAACLILAEAPGWTFGYSDLIAAARGRARAVTGVTGEAQNDFSEAAFQNDLINLYTHKLVEIYAEPVAGRSTIPERPLASRLMRYRALTSDSITNRLHQAIPVDVLARRIVTVCDGKHTNNEIFSALVAEIAEGRLSILDGGQPVIGEEKIRVILSPLLNGILGELARRSIIW